MQRTRRLRITKRTPPTLCKTWHSMSGTIHITPLDPRLRKGRIPQPPLPARRSTLQSSSSMHKPPHRLPRMTPAPTQLHRTKTQYQHRQRPSIPSAKTTTVPSMPPNIQKNTTLRKMARRIPATTKPDRSKIRLMASIRETPSLGTCRGATVRELH